MSKIELGCEPVVGSLTPSMKREYKLTNRLNEGNLPHKRPQKGKNPFYAIAFNFLDSRYFNIFATVGGTRATVYSCLDGGSIAILQAYNDEDKDESYRTLSWACGINEAPFLVVAGSNRIIRVINTGTEKIYKSIVGHGGWINEIRTDARRPYLIVSASKDESVRLWNVRSGTCILVLAGAGGHRNEVLSVDFHLSNIDLIASCGMDNTVKIWSIKEFQKFVEMSLAWTDLPSKFRTKFLQFPVFTASVHSDFVGCNRWLGDFILSKSVENEIVLWEQKNKEQSLGKSKSKKQSLGKGDVDILQKYPVPDCDICSIKFSCDIHFNATAIGNRKGKIFVWELQSCPPVLIARLSHSQCKSAVLQTAMSVDGSTIIGCCEDGTLWRWDEVQKRSLMNSEDENPPDNDQHGPI